MDERPRCEWARGDELIAYHDTEWGVPKRDTTALFELLVLEGAQAGLSWLTILKRRETYHQAFAGFDVQRVARFDDTDRERLLADPGIIRNRAKVDSAIQNARALLAMQDEGEDFSVFLWSFVGGEPIVNTTISDYHDLPAQTPESHAMSRALKQRGFSFVGPTICYAFMQAAGLVNDHTLPCFRHPYTP